MTRPTRPRTASLYHGAIDGVAATGWMLLAVAAFYLTAAIQAPGLAQLATAQLALGGVAVLVAAQQPSGVSATLRLTRPPPAACIAAAMIGATAWVPNLRLALWVQAWRGQPARLDGIERLLAAPHPWLTIACISLLPALCEELAFRGLWARGLATRVGALGAIAISAPMFGAYHLSSVQWLPTTLLGALLAWTTLRAGSLWIAIIIHAINNATAMLAARGMIGGVVAQMTAYPVASTILASTVTMAGLWMIIATRASPNPTQQ
jgi:membrane protease YdiL (CAAX protease family)